MRKSLAISLVMLTTVFVHSQAAPTQLDSSTILKAIKEARFRGTSPVTIKAHFQMLQFKGKPEGHYQLIWHDPGNWKEITDAPGYHEERGATNGSAWRLRSLDFTPKPFFDGQQATELTNSGWPEPTTTISSFKNQKIEGEEAHCAKIEFEVPVEVCVGVGSGHLLRYDNWTIANWKTVNGRSYATEFSLEEIGTKVLLFLVDEVIPSAPEPGEAYSQPAGASAFNYCTNSGFAPAILQNKPTPIYPAEARQQRKQGIVYSAFTVTSSGKVQDWRAVGSAGPLFDYATKESVLNRKYKPAMCAGKPIEEELQIYTSYTLSFR